MKANCNHKQIYNIFLIFIITLFVASCGYIKNNESNNLKKNNNLKGSGAGGIIKVINNTDIALDVTWSGTGCAGIYKGMGLVCEHQILDTKGYPQEQYTYKYNWGVTGTWLNVALQSAGSFPCSSSAPPSEDCIFDHYSVETKAYKTSICEINGSYSDYNFKMSCKL